MRYAILAIAAIVATASWLNSPEGKQMKRSFQLEGERHSSSYYPNN